MLALPGMAQATLATATYRASSGRRLVGLLATTDSGRHINAISRLRRETGYRRALSYSSTDRTRMTFALAVIDHLADSDDIWFAVAPSQRQLPRAATEPELSELAAFLAGCAYGDLNGTRHAQKRLLIEALKARTSLIG